MYIKELHLIGFGKFSNKNIRFNKDINILFGPNEAGKTTTIDAVAGVLFGFAGRRDDIKILKKRYKPWDKSIVYKAGISLNIPGFNDFYVERDFSNNKCDVFVLQGEDKVPSGMTIEEITANSLGINNFQLFRSTMLVRQEEIAALSDAELSNVFSKTVLSPETNVSVSQMFKKLGNKYLELNKGVIRSSGNNGPIRNCMDEIDKLEKELINFFDLLGRQDQLINQIDDIEDQITQCRKRIDEILPLLARFRNYSELRDLQAELIKRQSIIESVLTKRNQRVIDINNTVLLPNKKNMRYYLVSGIVLCLFSLLGILVNTSMVQGLSIAVFVIGITLLFVYTRLRKNESEFREVLNTTIKEQDDPELNQEFSVLEIKIINLQNQMDSANCSLNQNQFELLAEELSEKQNQLNELELELVKTKTTLNDFEIYALKGRDKWSLEGQLIELKDELKSLINRRKAIVVAVKTLKESVTLLQKNMFPGVLARASEVMAKVTDSKYTDINLELDSSILKVTANTDTEKAIPVNNLSAGTKDQIFLALRIAVTEFIAGDRSCPIIFDDSFITFDRDRRVNTIKLLNEMSFNHQIIIFTKDEDYYEFSQ